VRQATPYLEINRLLTCKSDAGRNGTDPIGPTHDPRSLQHQTATGVQALEPQSRKEDRRGQIGERPEQHAKGPETLSKNCLAK
jgi:hypothetical protein